MRCNAWRWLWGLIPLAIVWWIGILGEHDGIEADLKRRTEAALGAAKANWAASAFSGRDAVLTGVAADSREQQEALTIAGQVWGVRIVDNRSTLADRPASYLWSAVRGDKGIELTGYVPSEAARQAVLANVRAALPGLAIEDRMRVARGVDNAEQWLGGIKFGLGQLAGLRGGRIDLADGELTVEGEARDIAAYKTIKAAFARALPAGVALKSDKVTAPPAKPYTWTAMKKGGRFELDGHAPSERQRDALAALARSVIPNSEIVQRMDVATGEPRGWQGATSMVLPHLARMIEGRAELTDQTLRVTGLVAQQDKADQIRQALANEVPSGIRLTHAIEVDPQVVAADAARRTREAEESARRALEADAARQKAAAEEAARQRAAAEEAARQKVAADEAARQRAAADEAARQRAAADEAARQKAAADEAARQKAAADEAVRQRVAADEAARQKAAAAEAARQLAMAEEARRQADEAAKKKAAEDAARRQPEVRTAADRCQTLLNSAMKQGMINFKRASAELSPASHATLYELARIASECPKVEIDIVGHTDSEGTPERNQRLSERRAAAVVDFLIEAGVEEKRMNAIGFGDSQPIAPNDSAENMARNRRIEFIVRTN